MELSQLKASEPFTKVLEGENVEFRFLGMQFNIDSTAKVLTTSGGHSTKFEISDDGKVLKFETPLKLG